MNPWKILSSTEIFKVGFFRVRKDVCELPDGRKMPGYYVMEFSDWVNVLPIDKSGQVIAIKQYRHASGQTHLEIPGGSLDPRLKEDPIYAGQRELLEETGYESANWLTCGYHYPNPALQNNRMHTFIALECERKRPQTLDPYEDLTLSPFPVKELTAKLDRGEFTHSLMAASVALAIPKLRELKII